MHTDTDTDFKRCTDTWLGITGAWAWAALISVHTSLKVASRCRWWWQRGCTPAAIDRIHLVANETTSSASERAARRSNSNRSGSGSGSRNRSGRGSGSRFSVAGRCWRCGDGHAIERDEAVHAPIADSVDQQSIRDAISDSVDRRA